MASWTNNEAIIHPMTFTSCFALKFLKKYVHAARFLYISRILPNFGSPISSTNNLLPNKYTFTVLVACSHLPWPAYGRHVCWYTETLFRAYICERSPSPLLINPVGNRCPIGVIRPCFHYHAVYRTSKRMREQYQWSTLERENHEVHSPSQISDTVLDVLEGLVVKICFPC